LRLAKAGWMQGDPDRILKAPVNTVMDMIAYEKFDSDYQQAHWELNQNENS